MKKRQAKKIWSWPFTTWMRKTGSKDPKVWIEAIKKDPQTRKAAKVLKIKHSILTNEMYF